MKSKNSKIYLEHFCTCILFIIYKILHYRNSNFIMLYKEIWISDNAKADAEQFILHKNAKNSSIYNRTSMKFQSLNMQTQGRDSIHQNATWRSQVDRITWACTKQCEIHLSLYFPCCSFTAENVQLDKIPPQIF